MRHVDVRSRFSARRLRELEPECRAPSGGGPEADSPAMCFAEALGRGQPQPNARLLVVATRGRRAERWSERGRMGCQDRCPPPRRGPSRLAASHGSRPWRPIVHGGVLDRVGDQVARDAVEHTREAARPNSRIGLEVKLRRRVGAPQILHAGLSAPRPHRTPRPARAALPREQRRGAHRRPGASAPRSPCRARPHPRAEDHDPACRR